LYGNTLVIEASLGGLGEKGMLDSASTSEVPTPEDDGWANGDAAPTVPFRVLKDSEPDENWKEVFRFIISETESETHWLSVQKWKGGILNEDGRALAKFNQRLEEHQSAAALQARAIAGRIGLPESYAASLELAARRHDEGKRESVWQEAFSAPKDAVYAKTRGPLILKKLNGYRHELMSEKFLPEDPEFGRLPEAFQQLVRHIVVAHHGYARPTISCEGSSIPPSLKGETIAETAKRFVDLQEIWGPWGLAWWEALLRAADQRSSRGDEI
jgi:CRISPR-associated endonuclease/helicase Cas3